MGKLQTFTIVLDQTAAIFNHGQVISGYVDVELREGMQMRGIHLKFYGNANVQWTEADTVTHAGETRATINRYTNTRPYFNHTIGLVGKLKGERGPDSIHLVGRHRYPFTFTLPQNIPSSFEGLHGKVRYYLQAVIDKPWKMDDICTKAVTVLDIVDLNNNPKAKIAVHGQDQKSLCCWCCTSGPITAKFMLDRRGYVSGEFISISGEVNNESNRKINSTLAKLTMVSTFRAPDHTITNTRTVSTVDIQKHTIAAGESESWSGVQLYVPPLPPSLLPHCAIIDVNYIVVIEVQAAGPAQKLRVPLPIVIGTVPLLNTSHMFAATPTAARTGNHSAPNVLKAPIGVALPSLRDVDNMPPPPSYAECATGRVNLRDTVDSEHTHGQLDWAPMYTCYSVDPVDPL